MLRSDFLGGLGATTVAAAGPGLYQTQMTPSISIATCAPLSGRYKSTGDRLNLGVQAAINYSNELAGALGRTYILRSFDDQNNPANAAVVAGFATNDSTVIGVIGHVSSAATLQGIKSYGPAQIPLIVPYCTDDAITATQFRNVFRLQTKDSFEGAIFARTVVAQFKPKLPYVFVQDAEYGADVATGFLNEMGAAKIPAKFQQFHYEKVDFGSIADKALAEQPDYLFLAGEVGDMGPLVGVLRTKGYAGPIGASQGFFGPGTLQLGPAANGMMISSSFPYLPLAPSTVRLRQEFESHFGPMDEFAAFGYAAAQIIISAVARTNAAGRNATVTAIAQGIPIDTMTGSYSFNAFGDPLQPELYYYTVKDGKLAYLRQAHASTFMIK